MEVDSKHEALKFIGNKLLKSNQDEQDFADRVPVTEAVMGVEVFEASWDRIVLDMIQTLLNVWMVRTDREVGSPNKFKDVAQPILMATLDLWHLRWSSRSCRSAKRLVENDTTNELLFTSPSLGEKDGISRDLLRRHVDE